MAKRMPSRRAVAYHEAGHAVVAEATAHPVLSVTVRPDAQTLGRCKHHRVVDPLAAVAISVAGMLAEALAGEVAGVGGGSNLARMTEAAKDPLSYLAVPEEPAERLAEGIRLALGVLRTRWPAVVAVAEALKKRRTVDGEAVRRLMAGVAHVPGLRQPGIGPEQARRVDDPAAGKWPAVAAATRQCANGRPRKVRYDHEATPTPSRVRGRAAAVYRQPAEAGQR